jgi:hypothetical protein
MRGFGYRMPFGDLSYFALQKAESKRITLDAEFHKIRDLLSFDLETPLKNRIE